MSLVADYGSDVSSSEEETNESITGIETIKKPSLVSLLPPLKNKRNGPVKIVVDLPKPGEDDDDSDKEDRASKKSRSSSGSLFALLPAPKRSATGKEQTSSTNKSFSNSSTKSIITSTKFVPHTLTKWKSTVEQKTSNLSQPFSKIKGKEVKTPNNEDETDDITANNKFTESFFPLGSEITNIIPTNSDKVESSNIESNVTSESYNLTNDFDHNYNYQWDSSTNSYMEYPGYYYYESQLQQQNNEPARPDNQIDEEVIQKLGGRRGKEGPIIIKEINAADQMADAWQTQMSELTKPGKVGSGTYLKPTKGQKRKHNLMYLAYQAAAMENDLKEQFAANKKTKRETQAKYGF